MNENCKYCKTSKTCLENADYGSIYCQLHKKIPKVIGKTYDELQLENEQLKKQLEYIRSGEYYNQLRFERDMLQNIVDNGEVPKEDKEFIDCTHRNTELLEEKQELIDYLKEKIKEYEEKCNNTCVFLEQDRCETRINTYKEILSKIEKSDK